MRLHERGFSFSATFFRTYGWKFPALMLGMILLAHAAVQAGDDGQGRDDLNFPDYKLVPNAPRITVGSATAERLGSIFKAPAGPFAASRAGDWRLSNEHLAVTFASVEDTTTAVKNISMPFNGYRESTNALTRTPGALIDATVDGNDLDFVISFSQYAGTDPQGNTVIYDEITPVKRDDAVGLQLEGSPFDNSPVRLRTTYWLSPGSFCLKMESQFLDLPEGEKAPAICDLGAWGYATPMIDSIGKVFSAPKTPMQTDFYQVQGGNITIGVEPAEGMRLKGVYNGAPYTINAGYIPAPRDEKTTRTKAAPAATTQTLKSGVTAEPTSRTERLAAPAALADAPTTSTTAKPASSGGPEPVRRTLWVVRGAYGDVLQKIHANRKVVTGTFTGKVVDAQGKPRPNLPIRVLRFDTADINQKNFDYTEIESDEKGEYTVKLPTGYFYSMMPENRSKERMTGVRPAYPAQPGTTKLLNLTCDPECGLRIKVIDAATSQPLAARLRFEPIPPTIPVNFGFPSKANGYLENAYIPVGESEVYLPAGHWVVYASHGIQYDIGDRDVLVTPGNFTELVIPLKQSNPTPGWAHLETGVRTNATPGCTIDPKDIALMCVAEGIQWVTTGDFEKLTDLRPVIEKLGLTGVLGASRGFRTILPAHPEWGQFLIYPVREDAPDPAAVRKEWASLKTSQEFIAALRKLYPGALIQSELPYTDGGLGYFARKNWDAYMISWDPPNIELGIDAVNILPSRQPWDPRFVKGFWVNNLCRGRFYLPVGSNNGSTVFGAEPGYPRLLAFLGKGVKPSEEEVFKALRAHRVQITTGPFIDFNIHGVPPGGLCAADETYNMHIKVTAPKWVDTSNLTIDKEDGMRVSMMMGNGDNNPQRFPPPGVDNAEFSGMTLKDMMLDDHKDTLAAVTVFGGTPLRPALPAMSPQDQVMPIAIVFPIVVDRNNNQKYDPLTSYAQKGQ